MRTPETTYLTIGEAARFLRTYKMTLLRAIRRGNVALDDRAPRGFAGFARQLLGATDPSSVGEPGTR